MLIHILFALTGMTDGAMAVLTEALADVNVPQVR